MLEPMSCTVFETVQSHFLCLLCLENPLIQSLVQKEQRSARSGYEMVDGACATMRSLGEMRPKSSLNDAESLGAKEARAMDLCAA